MELSLSTGSQIDAERKFTDQNVQSLLSTLTGMDLHNKVFRYQLACLLRRVVIVLRPRRTEVQQRSHYALMTEERLGKVRFTSGIRYYFRFPDNGSDARRGRSISPPRSFQGAEKGDL